MTYDSNFLNYHYIGVSPKNVVALFNPSRKATDSYS